MLGSVQDVGGVEETADGAHCLRGGFKLSECVHSSAGAKPLHVHETACLCFVTRGSFIEGIRGRAYTLSPFEALLRPAREPHWDEYGSKPMTMISIEVSEPRLGEIRERTGLFSTPHLGEGGISRRLARRVHETFRMEAAAPTDLMLEGLLLELLASLAPRPLEPGGEHAFLRAVEFIRSNFARSFTVDDVAAAARVHPAQLARLFRAHAQCSVGDYLRSIRVEHAKDLLGADSLPLAEVALRAGFCDQSHLTRVFRDRAHVTPAAYRRAMRDPD